MGGLNATVRWGDYYRGFPWWERDSSITTSGNQSGWDMHNRVIQGNEAGEAKKAVDCKV